MQNDYVGRQTFILNSYDIMFLSFCNTLLEPHRYFISRSLQ